MLANVSISKKTLHNHIARGMSHERIAQGDDEGEARWGEMYAQAMDETGLEYGTLRNYKYTAGKIDLSLRSDKLSFLHHREVAALNPSAQKEMLA